MLVKKDDKYKIIVKKISEYQKISNYWNPNSPNPLAELHSSFYQELKIQGRKF